MVNQPTLHNGYWKLQNSAK